MSKFSSVRLSFFIVWNVHEIVFLPILFISYFLLLMLMLSILFPVAVISRSSRFFYVIFKSLYQCINAILNGGKSSSSFFIRVASLCRPWDERPFGIVMSFFLFSNPFVEAIFFSSALRMVPSTLRGRHYYYHNTPNRVFPISVSRWVFTEVWVTASLLNSPGLFSIVWPF